MSSRGNPYHDRLGKFASHGSAGNGGAAAKKPTFLTKPDTATKPDTTTNPHQAAIDRAQAQIDRYQAELDNPSMEYAATASERQSRQEMARQGIVYNKKLLREAQHRAESHRQARELAARSPEQKATDAAQQAARGTAALIAKLRKTVTDSPGSFAAKAAQEKIDRLSRA